MRFVGSQTLTWTEDCCQCWRCTSSTVEIHTAFPILHLWSAEVLKELFSTSALPLLSPATATLFPLCMQINTQYSPTCEVHIYVKPRVASFCSSTRDRLSSSFSVVFASAERNASYMSVITLFLIASQRKIMSAHSKPKDYFINIADMIQDHSLMSTIFSCFNWKLRLGSEICRGSEPASVFFRHGKGLLYYYYY